MVKEVLLVCINSDWGCISFIWLTYSMGPSRSILSTWITSWGVRQGLSHFFLEMPEIEFGICCRQNRCSSLSYDPVLQSSSSQNSRFLGPTDPCFLMGISFMEEICALQLDGRLSLGKESLCLLKLLQPSVKLRA